MPKAFLPILVCLAAASTVSCGGGSNASSVDNGLTPFDAIADLRPDDATGADLLDASPLHDTAEDLPPEIAADLHDASPVDIDKLDESDELDAALVDLPDNGGETDSGHVEETEVWDLFCDECEEGQVLCVDQAQYRPCELQAGCWKWAPDLSCDGESQICSCLLDGSAICIPAGDVCACQPDCEGKQCGDDGCGGDCGQCAGPLFCWGDSCVECNDSNDVPWDGCNDGLIAEFVVNEHTDDDQAHPSVAVFADGGFVISWDGTGPNDPAGIWARRFDADGLPLEGDIHVNDFVPGLQEYSRVAALADGGFVVTWTGQGQEDDLGIYSRTFGAEGQPGEESLVNTVVAEEQKEPMVAASAAGYHAIVYTSFGVTGFNYDILARIFDDATGEAGDEFLVNEYTDNNQQMPCVTVLADGRFLFVWASKPQDGSWHGIYGRVFDEDGIAGDSEFLVNSITVGNQWTPWVAAHDTGFVVVWDGAGDGDEQGIYARRFDSDANPQGEQFPVNEWVQGDQWEPSAAAHPDGRFVLAFESWLEVVLEGEVFLQPYLADGTPGAAQWQANLEVYDGQGDPSLAVLPDGGFIAVWYSFIQDGSERGIFAQRYDAQYNKLVH